MNETLRDPAAPPARLLAVSGLAQIDRLCRASAPAEGAPVFVEMLACRGGCVGGPAMPPGGAAIDAIVRTGELAGEPVGALLLLASGYRSLSMNESSIARIKYLIRRADTAELSKMLAAVDLTDPDMIRKTFGEYAERIMKDSAEEK